MIMSNETVDRVYSHPTKCLGCSIISQFSHAKDTDLKTGAWECPRCGYRYTFKNWKLTTKRERKEKC